MILLVVVLTSWLLLTLPAAVLMGKCIARGLAPAPQAAAPTVPQQRSGQEGVSGRATARAGRGPA